MKALQMSMQKALKERSNLPVCVFCLHLRVETEDKNKQICTCEKPLLCTQELANSMPRHELRKRFNLEGKVNDGNSQGEGNREKSL